MDNGALWTLMPCPLVNVAKRQMIG